MSRRSAGGMPPELTGLMTTQANPRAEEADDVDVAYRALKFFLGLNGWSIQRFCRLTRAHVLRYPDAPGPIRPYQFKKWRCGERMKGRFVVAATNVLGIPISYFYLVGEQVERCEEPSGFPARDKWRLEILLGGIENMDAGMVGQVQHALNRRRAVLSICKPDILEVIGEALNRP